MDLEVRDSKNGTRPFVKAQVGGYPATLLVDTGTFTNILSAGFANRHALKANLESNNQRIIDAHGRQATLGKLFGVPVKFEGESESGKLDFLISGITEEDGMLHPQELITAGSALVFDLGHRKLQQEPEEDVVRRLSEAPGGLRQLEYHGCTGEAFTKQGHRLIEVVINGVKTEMMLDTGASRTMLARNNPALKSMASLIGRGGVTRAVASDGVALAVDDVPVQFAGATFQARVIVSASSSTCGDGLLGADLLRRCTLVWARKSLWATCNASEEAK